MDDSLKSQVEVTFEFERAVIPDSPEGWRTSRDIMENFLLAGALEWQARKRIDPTYPFAAAVESALDPAFRYDTLGALLRYGPYLREELGQPAVSLDPAVNYAHFRPMIEAPERIGRLPLLGIIWESVDVAMEHTGHLRHDGQLGFQQALQQLDGKKFGKHGTALFMAAFYRKFIGEPAPPNLSPIESAYVDGEELPGFANGRYGAGVLSPNGRMYLDSIWTTIWTILTLRRAEHYTSMYEARRDSVMDVLERGARIASVDGTDKCWPGWPT